MPFPARDHIIMECEQAICREGIGGSAEYGGLRMEKKYSAKYEETKEALIAFCEIFHQEKCEMSVLIAVAFGGVVLLGLNIVGGNLSGSSRVVFLFLVKYVSMWITAFFAGAILSKTLFRRMMMSTAFGDAQELYRLRIKKRSKPLVVRVDFYEDRIVNDTGTKQAEYSYSNVKKLLESDKAIGFLSDVGPGPKNFFGVPKDAFEDADIEEVKAFLVEKCTGVKKFKKI